MSFRLGNYIPPCYVGLYDAANATSASMTDRSGKGNTLTFVSAPTVGAGGVALNGSTQYGTVPGSALTNLHTGIGTITTLSPTGLLFDHPQSIIATATEFTIANTEAGAGSEWSLEVRTWASPNSVARLTETLRAEALALGMDAGITHIGDGCAVGDYFYYPTDNWSTSTKSGILVVDPATLEPVEWHATSLGEISGLGYDAAERIFWACSFDSTNMRKLAGPGHALPIGTLLDTIALDTATVNPAGTQAVAPITNRITGRKELWLARSGAVANPVYDTSGNYIRTWRTASHGALSFLNGTLYALGSNPIESWQRVDEIVDGITLWIWASLGSGAANGDALIAQWHTTGNQRALGIFLNGTSGNPEARVSGGATANVATSASGKNADTMEWFILRHNPLADTVQLTRVTEGGSLVTVTTSSATQVVQVYDRPLVLGDQAIGIGSRPPMTFESLGAVGRYVSDTELQIMLANGPSAPLGTVETNPSYSLAPGETLTLPLTNLNDDAATPEIELPFGWSVVTNDEIASGATGNVVLRADQTTREGDNTALIGGNIVTLNIRSTRKPTLGVGLGLGL